MSRSCFVPMNRETTRSTMSSMRMISLDARDPRFVGREGKREAREPMPNGLQRNHFSAGSRSAQRRGTAAQSAGGNIIRRKNIGAMMHDYQNRGVAGGGVRKSIKTKGDFGGEARGAVRKR